MALKQYHFNINLINQIKLNIAKLANDQCGGTMG